MKKKWTKCDVDLAVLAEKIESFFRQRGFEVFKGENSAGIQIYAINSLYVKSDDYISVKVEKKTSEIVIKFSLGATDENFFNPPNLLTVMFFGGYFFTKRSKLNMEIIRLEKDFWKYMDSILFNGL